MTSTYQVISLPFEMTLAWSLLELSRRPLSLFGELGWQQQPIPFYRYQPDDTRRGPVDLPFFRVGYERLTASDDGALYLPNTICPSQSEQARLTVLDISILDPRIIVEAAVNDVTRAITSGPWALPGSATPFRRFGVPPGWGLTATARAVGKAPIEEAIIFMRLGFGLPRQGV